MPATDTPLTEAQALKRAVMWLGLLIEECECEPDETTVKASLSGGARDGEVIADINLGDDLRAFEALGARSDLLTEAYTQEA